MSMSPFQQNPYAFPQPAIYPSLPQHIRPIRPLTIMEARTAQAAETQRWRPVSSFGLDIPVTHLISDPQKNALLGILSGAIAFGRIASLWGWHWSTVINVAAFGAMFLGITFYRVAKRKNDLALNLLQHGVTHYDKLPRHIKLSRPTWQRLDNLV